MLAEALAPKHQPHWNEKIIFINGGPWATNPTSEMKSAIFFLFFRELLHLNDTNKVKPEHFFTENETHLRQTAHRIQTNITLLETYNLAEFWHSDGTALTPTQSGGAGPPPAQSERAIQRSGRTAPHL